MSEVSTQLTIAIRLDYIGRDDYLWLDQDLDDIGKMITGPPSLKRRET